MTEARLKKGIYNCPPCGAPASPQSVRCAYCNSSLAALVCSKCYGAVFIGMKYCPWCGEDAGSGKQAETGKGKCPRCNVDFLLLKVGEQTLSECPACGGLWADHDTLREICNRQEEQQAVMEFDPQPAPAMDAAVSSKRVYIPCPRCNKLMNRRQFAGCSGVIVDWCKAHGTWFDRDELRRIVQFILDGGLSKAREREKAQIEQARRNLQDERRNLERLTRRAPEAGYPASGESLDPDLFKILGGIWRTLKSGD
ncbi:MAG TPA: zf-TFIIB domain-containing protein [Acidobacteriota bacterium]|nr:zf-TFIIB domain-containing protein [Acidobacteriota bacterium]